MVMLRCIDNRKPESATIYASDKDNWTKELLLNY